MTISIIYTDVAYIINIRLINEGAFNEPHLSDLILHYTLEIFLDTDF